MYSRKLINFLSIFITFIIFITGISLHKNIRAINSDVQTGEIIEKINIETEEEGQINTSEIEEQENQYTIEKIEEDKLALEITEWEIEIPSISLLASISEGTDKDTMDKYVGHFTNTQKLEGNVGLAAHNRGYPVNYFAKLKDLDYGDEIIYRYNGQEKTYIVKLNTKISDIDWSYLQNTNENKITLITCIANEPAYRRCVQAIEKQERSYNIY